MKIDPYLSPWTQLNSKGIKDRTQVTERPKALNLTSFFLFSFSFLSFFVFWLCICESKIQVNRLDVFLSWVSLVTELPTMPSPTTSHQQLHRCCLTCFVDTRMHPQFFPLLIKMWKFTVCSFPAIDVQVERFQDAGGVVSAYAAHFSCHVRMLEVLWVPMRLICLFSVIFLCVFAFWDKVLQSSAWPQTHWCSQRWPWALCSSCFHPPRARNIRIQWILALCFGDYGDGPDWDPSLSSVLSSASLGWSLPDKPATSGSVCSPGGCIR